MPQPNMLRSTRYRIFACLSTITLLIGSAAAPVATVVANTDPTPTPEPLTPAQQEWQDWSARSVPNPAMIQQAAQLDALQEPGGEESPSMMWACSSFPKYKFSGLVYSLVNEANDWDEEIYYASPLCDTTIRKRLTVSPGADYEPQLSQDKQLIAFVSDRHSTSAKRISNIYIMSITGANQRRITTTAGEDRMPSFSPDGKKIVFVSTRTGNPEIFVMNSDGTNPVRLTDSANVDVDPAWSPDGKKIAWVRRSSSSSLGTLYTMNPDGTNVQAILANQAYLGQPRWSPTGTRLLLRYDPDNDSWYDLGLVNADGSGLKQLYYPVDLNNPPIDYYMGSWKPDERGFYFSATKYVLYDGKWYIESARMYEVDSLDSSSAYEFSFSTDYIFTPHASILDVIPPVSTIAPLPEYSRYPNVMVNYSYSDNYAGVREYSLKYSTAPNSTWYSFLNRYPDSTASGQGSIQFDRVVGEKVFFRIDAIDRAGNVEPMPAYDAWTWVYQYTARAKVIDARGYPISGLSPLISPPMMNEQATGMDGEALFYAPRSGSYLAQIDKPGYAAIPPQTWAITGDREYTTALTGMDERVENGTFAAQNPLQGWQASGTYVAETADGRHGGRAARLGKTSSDLFSLTSPTAFADDTALPHAVAYDSAGRLHILHNDNLYGILGTDGVIEPWPALPSMDVRYEIKFDFSGQPYLTTATKMIRWNGSEWNTIIAPLPAGAVARYAIDSGGLLHAIYNDPAAKKVMYIRQAADGTWQAPKVVIHSESQHLAIAIETNGTVHLAAGRYPILYMRILPNGMTKTSSVYAGPTSISLHSVPGRGVYLIYETGSNMWEAWNNQNEVITTGLKGTGVFASLQYDDAKNVYILASNQPAGKPFEDMKLSVLTPAGITRAYSLNTNILGSWFEVTSNGTVFLVYGSEATGTWKYAFRNGVFEQLRETNQVAQTISLDAGMQAPTLSFFYRIISPNLISESTLEAVFTPEGGDAVILFSTEAIPVGWTHAWADLTPFLGQSGLLTLRVEQAAGEVPFYALIDDVNVSSLPTPYLHSIEPASVPYPVSADAWINLYGENLQDGAQVFLGGAQATVVEYIDTTHIRFLAPQPLTIGTHVVKVVNPSGAENNGALFVGIPLFTPVIRR